MRKILLYTAQTNTKQKLGKVFLLQNCIQLQSLKGRVNKSADTFMYENNTMTRVFKIRRNWPAIDTELSNSLSSWHRAEVPKSLALPTSMFLSFAQRRCSWKPHGSTTPCPQTVFTSIHIHAHMHLENNLQVQVWDIGSSNTMCKELGVKTLLYASICHC